MVESPASRSRRLSIAQASLRESPSVPSSRDLPRVDRKKGACRLFPKLGGFEIDIEILLQFVMDRNFFLFRWANLGNDRGNLERFSFGDGQGRSFHTVWGTFAQ